MKDKKRGRFFFLLTLCAAWVALSLLGPAFCPYDPYATNAAAMRMPPGSSGPKGIWLLGTDAYGRCVFSRMLAGAGLSVCSALGLVAATFLLGTLVGVLCGYFGGILDSALMRLADMLLAFPQMVVAIAVAGILDGGIWAALIALGFTAWPQYARLARSHVASLRNEPFIQAARLCGEGRLRILFVHILPNCLGPLGVNACIQLGGVMMGVSGLSFLGLGVQPPLAEWGSMVSESFPYLQLSPWAVLAPGAAITVTVMLFNLLGDAAQELLEAIA